MNETKALKIKQLTGTTEFQRFLLSTESTSNVNVIRRRRRTYLAGCDGV